MGSLPRLLIVCAISLCAFARGNEPYPIVDRSTQEARDLDRRAILELELAAEQNALRTTQESMAKAPSDETRKKVHRHEENIKALRRELERVPAAAPIRVTARIASNDAAATKRAASQPAEAPFWDVYRRTVPRTDFQPPAKESP
jgi:hypothetical protein